MSYIMKIKFGVCVVMSFLIAFTGTFVFAQEPPCKCNATTERDLQILHDNMINAELKDQRPADVYNEAIGYLNSMNSGGFWDDIDFTQQPGSMWYGMRQLNRLRVIARAYMMPGQSLYQNDDAIKAIEKGLPHVESKMLRQRPDGTLQTPGNWWFYNLDLPSKLGYVLLTAKGKIDSKVYETSLNTLYFCLRNPTDWYLNKEGLIGGAANSVNGIKGNMFYAVLTENFDSIKFLSECYRVSLTVTSRPDEGMREDASHIAHGMIDYYLYFNDVVKGTITLNDYFKDSSYSATEEEFEAFASCICDGATWSIYQKVPDLKPRGRLVSGPFNDEERQIGTILQALKYVANIKCSYQQTARELLQRYYSGQEMHTGNRYLNEGDTMYHRSEDTYVSLSMSSSRVKCAEAWSGQGNSTLYTGDGYMQIYDDAAEYYSDAVISCMDWSRLAGTTVLTNTQKIPIRASYYTAEPFAGGVSNGKYGVAAMNFSQLTMPVYAHKSWFFFDDEVVCLGSGIESNSDEETHTYIDQRPERGGKFIVNGEEVITKPDSTKELSKVSWISNNGIGYYFPDSPNLMMQKQNRDGSWTYLDANNFGGSTVNMGLSFLWFNHGKRAKNEGYAYAVLPGKTPEMTAEYATGNNFEIIERSDRVHAVRDSSTGAVGIVFWPKNKEHADILLSYDNAFFDGIFPYVDKAVPYDYYTDEVEIYGKKGRVNHTQTTAMQGFEVSSQRLGNDVDFTVCWTVKESRAKMYRIMLNTIHISYLY